MIHWRARLIFLAVVALTIVASVGGAIHWGMLRSIAAPLDAE